MSAAVRPTFGMFTSFDSMPAETDTYKYKKYVYMTSSAGNHPQRLASISMSGSTSFDRNGRVSATGLSTTRTLVEIDWSILPTWTRIFRAKLPLLTDSQTGFGVGEFGLFSGSSSPWRVHHAEGSEPASVVVGTNKEYVYSRAVNTDPWTQDSVTTTNISKQWTPIFADGGHPISGGKGPDDDANSIAITGFPTPYFSGLTIYRLPWDQAWADESTLLADAFDAYIADLQATHPSTSADYSGTCTATVEFGY
jgi:hypothetical protein